MRELKAKTCDVRCEKYKDRTVLECDTNENLCPKTGKDKTEFNGNCFKKPRKSVM
jgi:hypothetical protein